MKVAHFCRFSPNKSGQYGTVKDLIKAERKQGIDARFVTTLEQPPFYEPDIKHKDGWMETDTLEEAKDADIYVQHTMVPPDLKKADKPVVFVLHGRPENSFMLGHLGRIPVYKAISEAHLKGECQIFVTFWEEFLYHWSMLIDKSILKYVPALVDLDKYSPVGEVFDFGQLGGSPNLLIADLWREDTTPYNIMHAACYYRDHYEPKAKVHIFGYPEQKHWPTSFLGGTMQSKGYIGHIGTVTPWIDRVYRAADIVITPHRIATRVVREAAACNTPVVSGRCVEDDVNLHVGDDVLSSWGADPRDYKAYAEQIHKCWQSIQARGDKQDNTPRIYAEKMYNGDETGKAMKKIFEDLL